MAQFVSYLRVSTSRQGESGLGVDAQRASVTAYLNSICGELLREFVEVESGTKRRRPVLVQSIAHCRQAGAILLIAKLDRLARNVAFVSSLMESGVEFVAADAPYANKLMIHILSAFAEYEREQISQRTRDALQAAKARGVRLGANGAALAHMNRQDAMMAAESIRPAVETAINSGCHTLAAVSRALNEREVPTREGAKWSPGTTHRLLRRLSLTTLKVR
jgi:DNA invertase Pin-like site-specific DNA recombinase